MQICDKFFRSPEAFLNRDDPSAFAAPAQFGPFRVLHQIGVGALGPVFRTYEPDRDRLVAVKVFRLDITPEQAQSLANELSKAAEAGLFHPSIVEPIAAGVEGSVAYNAEEYVAAESLDVAMRHYAPAQIETVLPFITQLGGAIDFARAAGVGHGALHPRDIFMTPDEARVTGFGVVEALERVGFRAPVRRPYSPPERIAGGKWSTPADVFSLAAVTYELLTGRRPAGLGVEIGALSPGLSNARSKALHDVLARAMDQNPSARYPTALAFVAALESAAHHEPAPTADAVVGPPKSVVPAAGAVPTVAAAAATARPLPEQPHKADPAAENLEVDDVDDVAAERDEDEAHHQLMLRERDEAGRRERDMPLDEDSAIEAEADRYAEDDFLLDAAGAASAPEPAPLDRFRAADAPIDPRALEDDEVMVDEPPSPLFRPEDLRREGRDPVDAPRERAARAAAISPPFAHYGAGQNEEPAGSRSNLPLIVTLVLGLLAGFGGGYWLWGRSAASSGREWSEQAVNPTPSTPSTRRTPSTGATSTPSAGATSTPPAAATSTTGPPSTGAPSTRAPSTGAPPTGPTSTPSAAAAPGAPPAGATSPAARATAGTVVVRSTPSGAGVLVNGRWRGRTPLTLENLPFARYDVRVVQPGYVAVREAVALSAGEPSRALSFRLQEAATPAAGIVARGTTRPPPVSTPQVYTGTIFVDSRPRNARVFVDGKPVGVTPVSVSDVRVGTHVVRLELPDHRIWSTTATVTANQQARVTGSLERIQ